MQADRRDIGTNRRKCHTTRNAGLSIMIFELESSVGPSVHHDQRCIPCSPSTGVVGERRRIRGPDVGAGAAEEHLQARRRGSSSFRGKRHRIQQKLPVLHHDATAESPLHARNLSQNFPAQFHDNAQGFGGAAVGHRRRQGKARARGEEGMDGRFSGKVLVREVRADLCRFYAGAIDSSSLS